MRRRERDARSKPRVQDDSTDLTEDLDNKYLGMFMSGIIAGRFAEKYSTLGV